MRNEAERYKFVLERSGLSKSAFAESLGISRSHNYHLERGTQKPPREVLERLAKALGVEAHELFTVQPSAEKAMERLHKDIIRDIRQVVVEVIENTLNSRIK